MVRCLSDISQITNKPTFYIVEAKSMTETPWLIGQEDSLTSLIIDRPN